jgi:hypothetical protein
MVANAKEFVMSRFVAMLLATLVLASPLSPALSHDANESIREQQAAECQRLGGTYDYPKCYLPDRGKASEPAGECDWACQLVIGAIGLATARIAYCRANTEKC